MTPLTQSAAGRRAADVAFLQALIAAGRNGEDACQRLVASRLDALGWAVKTLPYSPQDVPMTAEFASAGAIDTGERRSVVARRRGSGGGRSLIFFAHPDGEPHDDLAGWRHDPFAGVIADGHLHGWPSHLIGRKTAKSRNGVETACAVDCCHCWLDCLANSRG